MKIKKSTLFQLIKEVVENEYPKSDIEYITQDEAENLIRANKGKMIGVSFIKKNGETRHMNAILGVKKHTKGGKLKYDPKKYGLISVWDAKAEDPTRAYRMININTLTSLRVDGKKYVVNRD